MDLDGVLMPIWIAIGVVFLLAAIWFYVWRRRRRMQVARLDTYLLYRQPVEFTCPGCAEKLSFQLAELEEGVDHACVHGTTCRIRLDRSYSGREEPG